MGRCCRWSVRMILGGVRVVGVGTELVTSAVPSASLRQLDWRPPGWGMRRSFPG